MCHLYRERERAAGKAASDLSVPPSPLRARPRRVAAVVGGVAAVAAVAALLWPGEAPSADAGPRATATPVAMSLASDTGSAGTQAAYGVPMATPVAVEQAGAGLDDGVPSTARAHGSAGSDCSHGM